MRRKFLIPLFAVIFLFVFITPVMAGPPKEKKLKGQRINLLWGAGISFESATQTYVYHGFLVPGWKALTKAERNEILTTYLFELRIDGTLVKMKRIRWYNSTSDEFWLMWYVNFKSYHFPPGSYNFEGTWSGEDGGIPFSYSDTHLVTIW